MKLVNLTPHALDIHTANGSVIRLEKPSKIARLDEEREPMEALEGVDGMDIPVSTVVYGLIDGLPDPTPGVIYITSQLVAQRVQRPDVLSPGPMVRDEEGNFAGCSGLTAWVRFR